MQRFNAILLRHNHHHHHHIRLLRSCQTQLKQNTNINKQDLTDTIRRFYSQFNNIMSVLGKGCHEMNAVHLIKTYCLPTLTYGLENSVLSEKTKDKINVLWNNCFRHIFRCCWRESVRPLQYFCRTLPMLHLINQTKLLFWKKMYTNSNVLLYTLSRYASAPSSLMAVASQYGIHSLQQSVETVKFALWEFFCRDISYLERVCVALLFVL